MNKKQKTEFEKEVDQLLEFVNQKSYLIIKDGKLVELPKIKSWLAPIA